MFQNFGKFDKKSLEENYDEAMKNPDFKDLAEATGLPH